MNNDVALEELQQKMGDMASNAEAEVERGATRERMAEWRAERARVVSEDVELYNRQPYNPFNAPGCSTQLQSNPVPNHHSGPLLWPLHDMADLVPAVVALLNSRRLGILALPSGITGDNVSNALNSIQPGVECPDWHTRESDGRTALLRWEAPSSDTDGGRLHVTGISNELHLCTLSIRRRLGDSGVALQLPQVLQRLANISPQHLNVAFNVKVSNEDGHSLCHLAPTHGETDLLEDKESAWWTITKGPAAAVAAAAAAAAAASPSNGAGAHGTNDQATLAAAISGKRLASRLDDHLRKYIVGMFELTTSGQPAITSISFGVRDGDRAVVGVPVEGSVTDAKTLARAAVAKSLARLFPAPPLEVALQWRDVDTQKSKGQAMRTRDKKYLLVVTSQAAVRAVGKNAAWMLAVRCKDGELGAIFAPGPGQDWQLEDDKLVISASPKNSAKATQTLVGDSNGTISTSGDKARKTRVPVRCVIPEDVTPLPHFVVNAIVTPALDTENKLCAPSSALFRDSSFQCAGLFATGGADEAPRAFSLSPFAAWALLRHREDPPGVWRHVRRAYGYTAHVLLGAGVPGSASPVPPTVTVQTVSSLSAVGGQSQQQLLVLLGFDADQLRPLLMPGRRLVLLDTDPIRLQAAMKEVMDRGRGRVSVQDAGLFSDWSLLRETPPADEAEQTREAGTLVAPRKDVPHPHTPEGRERVCAFLSGSRSASLLYDVRYVDVATVARPDEEATLLREFHTLTDGHVTHVVARAVLRGAGTTALMHRLAQRLRKVEGTRVEVVHASRPGQVRGVMDVLTKWARASAPQDVRRVVLLVICDRSSRPEADRLKKSLAQLLGANPAVLAGLLEVVVHPLFDKEPFENHAYILRPVLQDRELSAFVLHFSRFFERKAEDLKRLQANHTKDMVYVGLPGLVVSSGAQHDSCAAAINALLQRDDKGRLLRRYLTQLALLELFAEKGMPGSLYGVSFKQDWDWLLTDWDKEAHRLQAFIYAVPLLRCTAGLAVTLDLAAPSGMRIGGSAEAIRQLPEQLGEAFLVLADAGVSLKKYLRKQPFGTPGDRMPRWIQVLRQHSADGQYAAMRVLTMLRKEWSQGAAAKVSESRTQVYVLTTQLCLRAQEWQMVDRMANEMVHYAAGTSSDFLARANRASVLAELVALDVLDEKRLFELSDICVEDFEHVLKHRDRARDFDPKTLLRAAYRKLDGTLLGARNAMDNQRPAPRLWQRLYTLLDGESPARGAMTAKAEPLELMEVWTTESATPSPLPTEEAEELPETEVPLPGPGAEGTAAAPATGAPATGAPATGAPAPLIAAVPARRRVTMSPPRDLPAAANQITPAQVNVLLGGR